MTGDIITGGIEGATDLIIGMILPVSWAGLTICTSKIVSRIRIKLRIKSLTVIVDRWCLLCKGHRSNHQYAED